MSINLLLVIIIAVLVTVIVVVALTSFITNSIFNKKEVKEERKFDINSLVVNDSLSQEIKEANKQEKKALEAVQAAQAAPTNKFITNDPPAIEAQKSQNIIDPFNVNNTPENKSTGEEQTEVFK